MICFAYLFYGYCLGRHTPPKLNNLIAQGLTVDIGNGSCLKCVSGMLLNSALTLATRMGYSDELVNYFKQKSAYKDVIPCRHF